MPKREKPEKPLRRPCCNRLMPWEVALAEVPFKLTHVGQCKGKRTRNVRYMPLNLEGYLKEIAHV